jgi:hypothetical protein
MVYSKQLVESLERRAMLNGAFDYLSDLAARSTANGFGPIGIDQSNGEADANDGRQIKLNGMRYTKGLGVHAVSEIRYALNGQYRSFVSDVGVDDEVGRAGSVVFQVFADGEKLFDSGIMNGVSTSRRVNVDVTARNELTLIVTTAGDDTKDDHGDWAGARLIRPVGSPPVITMPETFSLVEPNGSISTTGRFVDDDATAASNWHATVDYGDGRGQRRLTVDREAQTFELDHVYNPGQTATYNVTVRISDGGATGIATSTVNVRNVAPHNVGLVGAADENGALHAKVGIPFITGATFTDPGQFGGQKYTYAVEFGDGSTPVKGVPFGRLFEVNHTYEKAGTYEVRTTVTDDGGAVGSGTNTVVVTEPSFTFVSDLAPVTPGTSPPLYSPDRAINGREMKINGRRFARGVGVQADSELIYRLGGAYEHLFGRVGIDDGAGDAGSVVFSVYADGNKVFDSDTMTGSDAAKNVNLDVRGVSELKLVVTDAGDGKELDYANWAELRLA